MMRVLVFLTSVSLVVAREAGPGYGPKPFLAGPGCGINVGNAITSLVDASTHLYHGIKDCTQAQNISLPLNAKDTRKFQCTADVFKIVSSVALTSKYTVNIFGLCFDQKIPHSKCVDSGLEVASEIADLVAASLDIRTSCFGGEAREVDTDKLHKAKCVVDISKTTSFAMSTLAAATTIKKKCEYGPTACTAGIFEGIGSLAGVAEYTTAAFGDCSSDVPIHTECGKNIAKLIRTLALIAAKSATVKADCSKYEEYEPQATSVSTAIAGVQDGWDSATGGMTEHLEGGKTNIVNSNLNTLIAAMGDKYDARDRVPNASTPTAFSLTNAVLLAAIPVALGLGFFGGRRTRMAKVTTLQREALTQDESDFDAGF